MKAVKPTTALDPDLDLFPMSEPASPVKKTLPRRKPTAVKSIPDDAFLNQQLCLFQEFLANTGDEKAGLSNAVDLWDSIPRYSISRKRQEELRLPGGTLPISTVEFKYRGHELKILIRPARLSIDGDPSNTIEYYPGAREELVEHALRKIAVDRKAKAGFYDELAFRSGCRFTLHKLRGHLEEQGHSLRYDELIESLDILSLSSIDIQGESEDADICYTRMNYLSLLATVKRKAENTPEAKQESSKNSKWLVQFHPLITDSISNLTYRQFNYKRLMKCRSQLSRWLIGQLVLKYTQAALTNSFDMRYSTIKRDSALLESYKRERDAVTALDLSWKELKELGVLTKYIKKEERGQRSKIEDVVYTVFPSPDFVSEQKASNRRLIDAKNSNDKGNSSRVAEKTGGIARGSLKKQGE